MWKEGFRQLRLQRPGLVAASWGQLSLMSLKRVEHRGRGVLVGLLGCRSSFCARILKSGNTETSGKPPDRFGRGASLTFGEAAEQRVLKGQLLPAPLHPKVTSACKVSLSNPHPTLEWIAFQVRCTKSFLRVALWNDARPAAPS